MYANFACDRRPLKEEKFRVQQTIGGGKLEYARETASPAANLVKIKLIINSTISDTKEGITFIGIDIKDFFLQSPLPPGDQEYMEIYNKYFNAELRKLYNIDELVDENGWLYCEIRRGTYGLKQAAILKK
eukprot:5108508-Ditylum_brightwellii.AAC.1